MEIDLGRVLDSLPSIVWTALPDGHIDFVNQRWSEYTGLGPDEAKAWEWQAAINPEDLPRLLERWQSILTSGAPGEMEARLRRFDGQYRWYLVHCNPMRDDAGRIVKWCGTATDVDDFRRAEEVLRRRELDFQLIVDSIPVPVAVTTPSGEVEGLNRPTLDYFGKTFEELKGWKASDVVHPDDVERTIAAQLDAHQNGSAYNVESRHRRADGVYRWHNVRGFPLKDREGRILRWFHLLVDIDDGQRADEALRASESAARLIVDSVPGMVAVFQPGGELERVNRQLLAYYGKSLEELKRWEAGELTHPEDIPRAIEAFTRSLASGEPFEFEVRTRRFDGVYRWFQSRGLPLTDANGRIVRWYNLLIDIDERKSAEAALAASERNLKQIVNTIPALAWSARPDGTADFFNQHYLDYIGLSADQAEGWGWTVAVHPDDLAGLGATWQTILASEVLGEAEARLRRHDGEYRWFLFRASPLRDGSGNIVKWYGTNIDIEDRKRADQALRAKERDLGLIINTIPAMAWSARTDGSAEFFNQHYLNYVGLSVGQSDDWNRTAAVSEYWDLTAAVHPDDVEGLGAKWRAILASGEPGEAEARLRRYDGKYRWFLFRANPLRGEAGNIVKWYGTSTDIDDRKLAETNLVREKQLLEMIATGRPPRDVLGALCQMVEEAAPDCFCAVNPIDWNGPVFEYGLAPSLPASFSEPLHGMPVSGDLLPCGIAAHQREQVIAADMKSDPRWQASPVRTHTLQHGIRSVWSTPICSKEGHVLGTFCIYQRKPGTPTEHHQSLIAHATQIASIAIERSRTEAALRRSEMLLVEGQKLSSTGSFYWRVGANEMAFSQELCRIYEFDPNAVVTLEQVRARVHPEDVPLLSASTARVREGHDYIGYEIRLLTPDSRVKYLRTAGRVVRHQGGWLECFGSVQDVTERRLAEQALDKVRSELAHVSRVTSLGTMTASIAHEVNQPLAGIITNASTCLRMLAADPPNIEGARETARRTIRDGNRAADVIARLRALYRKRSVTIEPVDLNEAVREVIALSSDDLRRNRVNLRAELADRLKLVAGDRVQLQQVIMNVIRNAADAMSEVNDRPRQLVIRTEPDEDRGVRFSAKDVGIGFQAEDAERLFQAFYTTKAEGMGIGLSVSRSIVDGHRGRLWAQANEGPGATFAFSIPEYAEDSAVNHEAGIQPANSSAQSAVGVT